MARCPSRGIYDISQNIYLCDCCVLLCLVLVDSTHILRVCFTGAGSMNSYGAVFSPICLTLAIHPAKIRRRLVHYRLIIESPHTAFLTPDLHAMHYIIIPLATRLFIAPPNKCVGVSYIICTVFIWLLLFVDQFGYRGADHEHDTKHWLWEWCRLIIILGKKLQSHNKSESSFHEIPP